MQLWQYVPCFTFTPPHCLTVGQFHRSLLLDVCLVSCFAAPASKLPRDRRLGNSSRIEIQDCSSFQGSGSGRGRKPICPFYDICLHPSLLLRWSECSFFARQRLLSWVWAVPNSDLFPKWNIVFPVIWPCIYHYPHGCFALPVSKYKYFPCPGEWLQFAIRQINGQIPPLLLLLPLAIIETSQLDIFNQSIPSYRPTQIIDPYFCQSSSATEINIHRCEHRDKTAH